MIKRKIILPLFVLINIIATIFLYTNMFGIGAATLKSWTAYEILTASDLNTNFTALDDAIDSIYADIRDSLFIHYTNVQDSAFLKLNKLDDSLSVYGITAVKNFDINGGTIDGTVIGGNSSAAGTFTTATFVTATTGTMTVTGIGTIGTADINGGAIDGTVVGGSTAAAITGTTITGNTGFVVAEDGFIGIAAGNERINFDGTGNQLTFTGAADGYIFDAKIRGVILSGRDSLRIKYGQDAPIDSALIITTVSGSPEIQFKGTDGDASEIGINTSDQMVFKNAGGYLFDNIVTGNIRNFLIKTADYTCLTSESGSIYSNYGTTTKTTFTLVNPPTIGTIFTFIAADSDSLRIYIPGGGNIFHSSGAATTYCVSVGGAMCVVAGLSNSYWVLFSYGTWTLY